MSSGRPERRVGSVSKFEKRVILFAIVFVVIYLGAAAITLHNRFGGEETAPLRYESEVPTRAEGRLGMVELLLPMLVLLTLALTYAAVKKKRAAQMARLEQSEDEMPDTGSKDTELSAGEGLQADRPDPLS